jgi:Protein of unknown function (DUF2656)
MTKAQGRMLLSHNFDLADGRVPPLARDQFAAVFIDGLAADSTVQCCLIEHPHWIVEILFPADGVSPAQIGESCAQALAAHRRSHAANPLPDILILGGIKTTPATSAAPTALQPGEWGVDVVETPSAEQFLLGMGWESAIADKPSDRIFKVELVTNSAP